MLEVGIKAPDFELPDQNGKIHRLSDYAGQKVILYLSKGQYSRMYEAGMWFFRKISSIHGKGGWSFLGLVKIP